MQLMTCVWVGAGGRGRHGRCGRQLLQSCRQGLARRAMQPNSVQLPLRSIYLGVARFAAPPRPAAHSIQRTETSRQHQQQAHGRGARSCPCAWPGCRRCAAQTPRPGPAPAARWPARASRSSQSCGRRARAGWVPPRRQRVAGAAAAARTGQTGAMRKRGTEPCSAARAGSASTHHSHCGVCWSLRRLKKVGSRCTCESAHFLRGRQDGARRAPGSAGSQGARGNLAARWTVVGASGGGTGHSGGTHLLLARISRSDASGAQRGEQPASSHSGPHMAACNSRGPSGSSGEPPLRGAGGRAAAGPGWLEALLGAHSRSQTHSDSRWGARCAEQPGRAGRRAPGLAAGRRAGLPGCSPSPCGPTTAG